MEGFFGILINCPKMEEKMLNIYFGEMNNVSYGPTWFKYNYELTWFQEPFVQQMLEAVDKSKYVDGSVIESPVLGPIPPEKLSGGLKTLIMIYEMPDRIFDATSCGPNCARWLLEIGKKKDVTVNLRYLMPMEGLDPFELTIANNGEKVRTAETYTLAAVDYL